MPITAPSSDPSPFELHHHKALVVDDSALQRRILKALLTKAGYQVSEAASGEEALALSADLHPDIVVSDWMMPGMDGLEFCRRFRSLDRTGYGYFILLTAKREKDDIAEGLHAGADDFLSKPVNKAELRARIIAGERILKMQRQLTAKNRMITETLAELQQVYDAIERDLQQARHIQQALLPPRTTDIHGSRLSTLLKPCGHVGGDLVGHFTPGDGRVGFYNIDVSGHGITSAMITARVASYLSNNPKHNLALEMRFERYYAMRDPGEVATMLNGMLSSDQGTTEYLTMAYASADLDTGRVRLVQAGHPSPLLLRADGGYDFLGTGGLPIGLIDPADYPIIDCTLVPGDRLLFYSDGFTELDIGDGDMLGEEGLIELITDIPPTAQGAEFLDDLHWRLCERRAAQTVADDDISAILFEFHPK